jgi:hypothetical protein
MDHLDKRTEDWLKKMLLGAKAVEYHFQNEAIAAIATIRRIHPLSTGDGYKTMNCQIPGWKKGQLSTTLSQTMATDGTWRLFYTNEDLPPLSVVRHHCRVPPEVLDIDFIKIELEPRPGFRYRAVWLLDIKEELFENILNRITIGKFY